MVRATNRKKNSRVQARRVSRRRRGGPLSGFGFERELPAMGFDRKDTAGIWCKGSGGSCGSKEGRLKGPSGLTGMREGMRRTWECRYTLKESVEGTEVGDVDQDNSLQ